MLHARRITLLRLCAMAGLVLSALLTYDKLNPERAFCPLAEACKLAGESPLGNIAGIPTSVLGLGAFGGLFLLTLLPMGWARSLLKPAGLLAAVAGAIFFAYQALELEDYCPLCLGADAAGLLCGVITLTWRETSGRRARGGGESGAARVAWTFAAVLAVTVPFAWPRAAHEAYEEITPATDVFDDEPEAALDPEAMASAKAVPPPRPPASLPAAPVSRVPPGSRLGIPPRPGDVTPNVPTWPASAPRPSSAPPPVAVSAPVSVAPSAPPPPPPPPPAKPELTVVEYLNAYCPHCRATHARLEKVIAEMGVPVRRRRVYTWATDDYPAWARACALAQSLGLEERMFEELLRSRGPDLREVQGAAQRAGLDPQALAAALRDPAPPPRLVKDRQLFLAAGLKGLPTLDIGRRRLMGEQSEAELRSALEAARALLAPPR